MPILRQPAVHTQPDTRQMTTKEHILKAARQVFERFGFNKASMADIAHMSRKGRRTIYTHFSSKEAVFKAVIDKEVSALANQLRGVTQRPVSAEEKLRLYMHTRMNAVRELTVYYDALRQDLVNNMGIVEQLREEYDAMEVAMIREILDEGNASGTFAIDDTHLVAEAIVTATKGFELPIFMGRSDFDHKRLIDPLISLLYTGIKNNA